MLELLKSLFSVVAVGILLGAGLPALYALSIHFLSPASDGSAPPVSYTHLTLPTICSV